MKVIFRIIKISSFKQAFKPNTFRQRAQFASLCKRFSIPIPQFAHFCPGFINPYSNVLLNHIKIVEQNHLWPRGLQRNPQSPISCLKKRVFSYILLQHVFPQLMLMIRSNKMPLESKCYGDSVRPNLTTTWLRLSLNPNGLWLNISRSVTEQYIFIKMRENCCVRFRYIRHHYHSYTNLKTITPEHKYCSFSTAKNHAWLNHNLIFKRWQCSALCGHCSPPCCLWAISPMGQIAWTLPRLEPE